jgi:hypothetical protein
MRALRRSAVFISRKSPVGVLQPKLLTKDEDPLDGGELRQAAGAAARAFTISEA